MSGTCCDSTAYHRKDMLCICNIIFHLTSHLHVFFLYRYALQPRDMMAFQGMGMPGNMMSAMHGAMGMYVHVMYRAT